MAKRPKPSSSAPRAAQAADATVSVAGAVLRVLGTILLIVLVTGLLFLCIFAYYVKNCLSTDLDVQLSDFTVSLSSSILYEDSDGNWQNLTNLSSTENRVWIDYADIPKDMEHAAVAIEDKRFYKHKGVDWYRTTGAFINMFLSMKNDFGGSTITQQLIKNLTKQDDITVQRKLLEIFQALEFEKSYDKEEIMEWYLNIVYFGEGCNGVYTAAETYFGKEPKDLTLAECASIIGITNNPSKYDPFISRENNKARQETILKQMYEQGYINKEQYDEAVAQELVFVRSESDDATQTIYSYYAEAVINDVLNDLVEQKGVSRDTARTLLYSGGYQVYSCYDPSIQQAIDDVYTDLDAAAPVGLRPAVRVRHRHHGPLHRRDQGPVRRHGQKDHQLRHEPGHAVQAPARIVHQADRDLRPGHGARPHHAVHAGQRFAGHQALRHELVSEKLRRRQLRRHHHPRGAAALAQHRVRADPRQAHAARVV